MCCENILFYAYVYLFFPPPDKQNKCLSHGYFMRNKRKCLLITPVYKKCVLPWLLNHCEYNPTLTCTYAIFHWTR